MKVFAIVSTIIAVMLINLEIVTLVALAIGGLAGVIHILREADRRY